MSLLDDLNPVQRDAVLALDGPVMIVAGAGSGKTRVLTYKIAHLLKIGVPPFRILALTFTNKAAREMKERIAQLSGPASQNLWMGTFHSVFARILRREAVHLGFSRSFSIYDTTDTLNLIKSLMTSMGISLQLFPPQAVRSRISLLKNGMVSVDESHEQARDPFEEKCALIYRAYQDKLLASNAMDFDDLLLKPLELFQRRKAVADEYQQRFQFVFVDEYQDTNRVQYLILRNVSSRYRNICVVGDDAQSIYSFRGADIRNMLDFEKDYPDRKIFRLEQNYRSTQSILRSADLLIKHNTDQIEKNLWTDNEMGDPVALISCRDEVDESHEIVRHIMDDASALKLNFKDFAILYRTNAQSRSLEEGLRKSSIPYVIVGGIEFYQRKEIKDVLAYYKVLANPQDDESYTRIINTSSRGIGKISLRKFSDFAAQRKLSLSAAASMAAECPGVGERPKKGLLWLASYFEKFRRLRTSLSLSELARMMVDELGLLNELKEERTQEALGRWENVQELLSGISEFSAGRADATLEDFLGNVALVSDIDTWNDTENSVTLMTLHSAKGLEFPVVFIAGVEEGLLPFYTSDLDQKDLEEERRLCYVGMTRAMRKLYLTCTTTRFRQGDISSMTVSRFVGEMGEAELRIERQSEWHSYPGGPRGRGEYSPFRRTPHVKNEKAFDDVMPDYEDETDVVPDLQIGMLVVHESFGEGEVVAIHGKGEALKVIVDFSSVGRKHLLAKFAHLRIHRGKK